MKRNLKNITCQICGFETKTNGIAEHIKYTHNITVDEYISKYGEYRKKYLDYNNRSNNQYECKICKTNLASERHLSFHVKTHNITKEEYVLKYVFNGVIPKCECGCGTELKIFKHTPYTTRFITGHNVFMHLGMVRSNDAKMNMREAAINRIKNKKGVYFYNGVSKEELKLLDFIKDNYSGTVVSNDISVLNGHELDIFLPELKLAFELNGDRFHSDLYKTKYYHLNKTKECNDKGIHLIHIWMTDWIKKKEIVKSIILSKLGCISTKIYARKTEIREISNDVAHKFLNENHLQGTSVCKIRLGIFYDGELMQVMTFGKLRSTTGLKHIENSYELIRMCSKLNTTVLGGSNKLLNFFIKKYNPGYILSYANRDWSNGNVYDKMGFSFIKFTTPGYFYTKSHIKYHRFNFQKHKLIKEGFDPDKTEYEIMTDRGFYKIWNTGNSVYEMHCKKGLILSKC